MALVMRSLLAVAFFAAATRAIIFQNGRFRENALCEVKGRPLGACLAAKDCAGVGGVSGASCGLPGAEGANRLCCQPKMPPDAARPQHAARSRQACRQHRSKAAAGQSQSCDNFHSLTVDREVRQGDFPYFAGLGYASKSSEQIRWICGGGLISEDFVITTAVCARGDPSSGNPIKVRLGGLSFRKESGGGGGGGADVQELDVAQIVVHPDYSSKRTTYNDIALLRLSQKARLSRRVQPACLYPEEQVPVERAVAVGFGADEAGELGTLNKVDIPFIPHQKCSEFYNNTRLLPDGIDSKTQFCAGEKGRDTCKGDSGAPLIIREGTPVCAYQIIGLTSFGPSVCGGSSPGVYTKVYSYIPWIEKIVWE